jgi:serine/threonine-protein kinase
VIFTSIGSLGPDAGTVEVFSLESGRRKTLLHGGTYGRYLPNGILTYINQGTLYAVAFDLDRLEVQGSPVTMLQDVSYSSSWGFAQLDFSSDGTLVYRRDPSAGQLTIQWLDNDGTAQPLLSKPGPYQFPQFSPNGRRLAFVVTDSGSSNIIAEGDPNQLTPLTSEDGVHANPVWSPDGQYMIYGSGEGMSWVVLGGNGKPHPLTQSSNKQFPWSFTPDGKRLAFFEISPFTGFDLWTVALQTDGKGLRAGKPEPFLVTPYFEVYPAFSPDGRWIAYGSNKSGAWAVYVRAFPGGDSDVKISQNGARIPRWPANGHQIFYNTDDQSIMTVSYRTDGNLFQAGNPRLWSQRRLANTGVLPNFDVTPDGKRVAALMPAVRQKDQPVNEVTFLLNFSDEVRRKLAIANRNR